MEKTFTFRKQLLHWIANNSGKSYFDHLFKNYIRTLIASPNDNRKFLEELLEFSKPLEYVKIGKTEFLKQIREYINNSENKLAGEFLEETGEKIESVSAIAINEQTTNDPKNILPFKTEKFYKGDIVFLDGLNHYVVLVKKYTKADKKSLHPELGKDSDLWICIIITTTNNYHSTEIECENRFSKTKSYFSNSITTIKITRKTKWCGSVVSRKIKQAVDFINKNIISKI